VLEVFPTGGMLWHYRYRLNGKQERVTLGRYPALSLKRARAERDRRETLVAQGQSPAVQKQLAKQGAAPDTTVVCDVTTEDVRAIIWRKKDEGFDAAAGNIRRQFKIGLHLILLTMVRKSELLFARWEHVDFEQAEWHIPAEHSKTGKPHIVFLSRQAIALFRELRALAGGSELVMPGRGSLTKPFAHNEINTALKTALQGQDIPFGSSRSLARSSRDRL